MTADLRKSATSAAESLGFSSLQETVRLFLKQLAKKQLSFSFSTRPTTLSLKAIKRYDKMTDEINTGKVKAFTTKSVDKLMEHLS